jgi:hypothetical protein
MTADRVIDDRMREERVTDDRMTDDRLCEEGGKEMVDSEEWKKQLGIIVRLGSAYVLDWMWRVDWSRGASVKSDM